MEKDEFIKREKNNDLDFFHLNHTEQPLLSSK